MIDPVFGDAGLAAVLWVEDEADRARGGDAGREGFSPCVPFGLVGTLEALEPVPTEGDVADFVLEDLIH